MQVGYNVDIVCDLKAVERGFWCVDFTEKSTNIDGNCSVHMNVQRASKMVNETQAKEYAINAIDLCMTFIRVGLKSFATEAIQSAVVGFMVFGRGYSKVNQEGQREWKDEKQRYGDDEMSIAFIKYAPASKMNVKPEIVSFIPLYVCGVEKKTTACVM